ncbi:MAG: MBOAT family protein [Ruminococcaceae bacterium]|nr:MBOAT family protein [Oscillospiraceae bacterium]
MIFSSVPFLYYFLPMTLLVYFLVPRAFKNAVLMCASLLFYGWGEPRYLILMVISVAVGYIGGLLIEKYRGTKAALWLTWITVGILLSFLAYFKYANFFIDNFNAITGLSVSFLRIALPVGISFYTFQILSYDVDVYRGDVKAQRNVVDLAAYVTMFPQLIAGPIVRYSDIEVQLRERTHTFEKISAGIRRFVIGLGKKILIADVMAALCDTFRASDEKSVLFYWMYAIAFCLNIYFDFSGYSDMAIGLGKILGFNFLENFNYPYISASVTEFWRRWHMSLGSWFRDYVYIPLGGNRVSKPRWFFNIFVVWMLTGFWHGAAWNFILWGLLFAVLLVIEKLFLLKALNKLKVLNHVYVLFFVMISFVLFNAADLPQAYSDVVSLFGAGGLPLVSQETLYYLQSYMWIFLAAIIGATPLPKTVVGKLMNTKVGSAIGTVLEPLVLIGLLTVMTAYLVDGSFSPFLYFRF